MKLYEEYLLERFVNPQEELQKLRHQNEIGKMLKAQGVVLGKGAPQEKKIAEIPTTKQLPQTQPTTQPQIIKRAFTTEEKIKAKQERDVTFAKWHASLRMGNKEESDKLYKTYQDKNEKYKEAISQQGRVQ